MEEKELRLDGDLCQMGEQSYFLRSQGITLRESDVYRYVSSPDIFKALFLIYNNSIEGWWHYEKHLVSLDICTKEDFNSKLRDQVNAKEYRYGN